MRTAAWSGGAKRSLAAFVAALVLSGAPSATAAEPDHPLGGAITGESISKDEQFKGACGVAVDPAGNVYIADYYQNRVVVFNKKEEFLTQITNISPLDARGVAPIDGPCDLAVDSTGHLYVNEYHRGVVRFTPAHYPPVKGTAYGSKLTIDEAHSTGVAVDPATDNVYVDDRTYVAVYDSSGAPVMDGAEPLRIGEGSLEDGYGVAISRFPATAGWVYAADAASETVKAYDPAVDPEEPELEIHGESTDRGRFYLTDTDLVVDPDDGHLYLTDNIEPHFEDTPEMVVDEFSPAGYYRGPVPGSFANGFASFLQHGEPSGLAISGGELYVTSGNWENASVYIFGPPGPFEAELLEVSKSGDGEGTVTSLPGGIGCGPVCTGEFEKDTTVVLRATPAAGSEVGGWSGCDGVPSPNRCSVTMSSARSVDVEFVAAPTALASPGFPAAAAASALPPAASGGPRAWPRWRPQIAGASEVTQQGRLRVSLSGELAPKALPRTGKAPVAVSLGGDISTTDGSDLPRLRELRIEINRGGQLEDRGLAVCPTAQILVATTDRALAACREALVGSGTFGANIVLKGQEPYPSIGRLLIFNGRENGKPVMLGHIYARKPFATSFVITFKISSSGGGRFGTVLTASLPESLGNWGYVTGLQMRLSRRYRAGGEQRSYLSAGCPAPKGLSRVPFPLIRASFGFEGGKTLSGTLNRVCKAR